MRDGARPMRRRGSRIWCSLALLLWFVGPVTAPVLAEQPPRLAREGRFLPVLATHGMVVAQESMAARIGVDILQRGGNAVDAAVAVAFALAVTLPRAGNLGGGGFMLVHLAKSGKTIAIDYREMAAAATTPETFLNAEGQADPERSRHGGLAVGVPGTVAGLALAHRRYGSGRLSLAELAAPAITLAQDGFVVGQDLSDSLYYNLNGLRRWPSSTRIFLDPEGRPLEPGQRLVQKDLAATLTAIGRDGEAAFYQGPIAEKIVTSVRKAGGEMELKDLAAYRAVEREPVSGTYHGHKIVSMPPPSAGGSHLIEILNILEGFSLANYGPDSARTIHLTGEAMRRAYADRAKYLGDPDSVTIPLNNLLSKTYASRLRKEIDADHATPSDALQPLAPLPHESDQTTHFSVVDAEGNAVSNTYTLNFSFGLGLVAEGTGVLLNNELDDFAAKPGAPNAYGLVGGNANAPGPRKRPLSSMTPTMVFGENGALELVTGSPGGSRIITIVLGLILDMVDFKMNIAEATAMPRVHHQWLPDQLQVERGLSTDTIEKLQELGHHVKVIDAWGSAQSIALVPGFLMGAADTRQRGPLAIGY
ncbi:gamma-glutamyltransferase [Beijerinckia indica]|uniref:Glutathione hydrolase proenzyme n=1 Tax=Beijerinckia indica subsp. indica (strain ATCC 9039 / DSM 1715 / NCIMB 8712) TaxID=395963 RepID=B2IGB1_BEII9|nr:gamma-glutamyltransferase [Beijerinckia indica]ACB97185.1 gamma-glutamyltransferase [Beijerinckia indica subsp. indica ATCC 9039]